MKRCNKCQENKKNIHFYSLGGMRSHLLQSWCKECVKAQAAKRGFKKSPNASLNSQKYQEKNREVCAERSRNWYKKNKDKVAKRKREYDQTPHRRAANRIHTQNYLNRKIKTDDGSITFNSLVALFASQSSMCAECGRTINLEAKRGSEMACELDHIYPISRGGRHIISNVQWLCAPCNKQKWAHVPTNVDKLLVT